MDIVHKFLAWCKASAGRYASADLDERDVFRLSSAMATVMGRRADAFCERAHDRPLAVWYSSDCTSYLVHASRVLAGGDVSVRRGGRDLAEFLCEKAVYLSLNGDSDIEHTVALNVPRHLQHGKTALIHLQCMSEFVDMPKAIGHSSLSVTGCCFDSAVFEAMFRLIQQRHAGYWAENGFNDWGDAKDKRMMEDLIIGCPCAAHIAQTGFKWAIWPHGDGALLKELFLVCEGLRNSIIFFI